MTDEVIDVTASPPPYERAMVVPNDPSKASANRERIQTLLNAGFGSYYFPRGRYFVNGPIEIKSRTERDETIDEGNRGE